MNNNKILVIDCDPEHTATLLTVLDFMGHQAVSVDDAKSWQKSLNDDDVIHMALLGSCDDKQKLQEIIQAIEFIRMLRDEFGLTVFWIEHVMGAIMEATDQVIVLDQGKILMTDTPEKVAGDPRVIQAYLGE